MTDNLRRQYGLVHGIAPFYLAGQKEQSSQQERIIEFYVALRPGLLAYLRSMGLRKSEADDVIQETFLRLVRHLTDGGNDSSLRSWIFRVAHNLSVDLHRNNERDLDTTEILVRAIGEHDAPFPNPEESYLQEEEFRRVQAAIMKLSIQQRRCILLRAQGLRYREIAAVLGTGVPNVSELVGRALVQLSGNL